MSLQQWLKNGWLKSHETSKEEIADLLAVINRDLMESKQRTGPDWKLAIAYNAALQCAVAALAAGGYRVERERHHERAIASLEYTIALERSTIELLQRMREKRNIADYQRIGMVSENEAEKMLDLAEMLQRRLIAWLYTNHPELVTT